MNTGNVMKNRELEKRTKRIFDESVSALDAATLSKLTQARYKALEQLEKNSAITSRSRWIPACAVAVGAFVVMVFWQGQPPGVSEVQTFDVVALSDLEILLGDEELDMIQELEFYAWLDEQAEIVPADGTEGGVG
jgi:Flp pilus assembly protein TadB